MCRLFGFKSIIQSQVHSSLLNAENALGLQSNHHPDGWGVAYYVLGSPHLIKSDSAALNDQIFKKISGVVSSDTVLAHIRKATLGRKTVLNTHPFQFGQWVFAHNGNIKKFASHKDQLQKLIDPKLLPFILGETDSEFIFFIILSLINKRKLLSSGCNLEVLSLIVQEAVNNIIAVIGNYCEETNSGPNENYLTFIITNGNVILAHQGGKQLYYSTYKKKCSDREICSYFSNACESPSLDGKINHLIFSSEPLSGENIWLLMQAGQIIATDNSMEIQFSK